MALCCWISCIQEQKSLWFKVVLWSIWSQVNSLWWRSPFQTLLRLNGCGNWNCPHWSGWMNSMDKGGPVPLLWGQELIPRAFNRHLPLPISSLCKTLGKCRLVATSYRLWNQTDSFVKESKDMGTGVQVAATCSLPLPRPLGEKHIRRRAEIQSCSSTYKGNCVCARVHLCLCVSVSLDLSFSFCVQSWLTNFKKKKSA